MITHNIRFHGETRKNNTFGLTKVLYLELTNKTITINSVISLFLYHNLTVMIFSYSVNMYCIHP